MASKCKEVTGYDVVCPYCGWTQDLSEWNIPNPYDEFQDWTCDNCEKDFKFSLDALEFTSWTEEPDDNGK